MNWLQTVLKATEEAESPERFFYWAAMSAISAVTARNVYLDRYMYRLYPNIYVIIIGPSGMRKGLPILLAKSIVERVNNIKVISGRNSIQAVIQTLAEARSKEEGGILKDAKGFLVSGELAAFLVEDPVALTLLTDLFDTHAHDKWENTLKSSGVSSLTNVFISMIAAANEIHFKEAVPNNARGGGFIARTFIVFSKRKKRLNDLMEAPSQILNLDSLASYLKDVSKLKGKFTISKTAKEMYSEWYISFNSKEQTDFTGSTERFHDQVLKAAMLISLSRDLGLIIEERDMQEALEKCTDCLGDMRRVIMGTGASIMAPATRMVIVELLGRENHAQYRDALLRRFWGDFDALDLDRIVDTLTQSGMLLIKKGKEGKPLYVLNDAIVDKYERLVEEEDRAQKTEQDEN